jgi:hypothetical protein
LLVITEAQRPRQRRDEAQARRLVDEFSTELFEVLRREEESWQSSFTSRIAELQQRVKSLEKETTKGKPPEAK